MSVTVLRSRAQLEALADEWQELASAARSPLLDYDWFAACAETLHQDGDLRVVTARSEGRLAGVAPLVQEAGPSGCRLALLGASKLFEPSGWLCRSSSATAELLDAILALRQPVLLQRTAVESDLARTLADLTRGRALAIVRNTAASYAVPTRGSWSAYYATLSSRITNNLPRVRRKAERELGRMEVAEHMPTPAEVDALLDTLIAVENSGWKGRGGSSLAHRTDLQHFFRRYCYRAANKKQLRVVTLSFGSSVAAVELSIEAYDRIWQLKIGYQEAVAAYYPGLQLTEASIRAAFSRGLEAYEFLGGAESWEQRWRPEPRSYQALLVYPFTASSVVSAWRDFAGGVWRRAHTLL